MEEAQDQTASGLCFHVRWNRNAIWLVENMRFNMDVTKYDFILAGLKTGVIDTKFDVAENDLEAHTFTLKDLQRKCVLFGVIPEQGAYWDDYIESLIAEIDSIGLDNFTIIVQDEGREYEAQFYGAEYNYLYKALTVPVVEKDLENAMLYAELLKRHYQRVYNSITASSSNAFQFSQHVANWNLANEPGWKQLEDKVDYIYRHYKRI